MKPCPDCPIARKEVKTALEKPKKKTGRINNHGRNKSK
jgi:hypothetical protein